ncbi:MAG: endonuclease III [Myxococcota bacterium]
MSSSSDPELKKRARAIAKRLQTTLPTPVVELDFDDPWQLLMATIMAAQSTDKTVNKVGQVLFAQFSTPAALAGADPEVIETIIHPTGFFRNKTKSIQAASRAIVEQHNGQVPKTMAELVKLPGVARKTANVVLGKAFGIAEGIVVDVHCTRVSQRLQFTQEKDAKKIERALIPLFPQKDWIGIGNRLVLHGRYVCLAKKPNCPQCPISELCPSAYAPPEGAWKDRAKREQRLVMSRGEDA